MSEVHNLIIIGSGPAGYTAGVYAARAALAPLMFAGEKSGGQLMYTTEVENFPGFKDGIEGPLLMGQMMEQATRFGTQIEYRNVERVDFTDPNLKKVYVKIKGEEVEFQAKSVIITTGAEAIMLNVPGEEKFYGHGVSVCAVCDAAFYKEKDTYVVGGGDSAMEDIMALTKFAKSITVVHRRDRFKASKIMQDRVLKDPKVKVLWNTEVKEIIGEDKVTQLRLLSNGEEKLVAADGVFLAIGHKPTTQFLQGHLELDAHGYILTRLSMTQRGVEMAGSAISEAGLVQFPTMTSVSGVFAAGDVVDVRYKQAITAAGQGCSAALDAERWLESGSTA